MQKSRGELTYKAFGQWALAGVNTCMSLLKVIFKSRGKRAVHSTKQATCFVLGNGPSMAQSLEKNLDLFRSGDVMCVNSFALSEVFVTLRPAHYVIIDPGLWYADNVLAQQTFEAMAEKCTWFMRLYVPREAASAQVLKSLRESNEKIEVYFMNYVVFKGWKQVGHWLYNRQLAMPQSQNVMVAALFWAVNAGYKEIELFGADHNWHTQLEVDANNVVCTRHEHFYSKEGQVKLVPFYKLASTKETFRMDEIFHAWAKVFAGYMVVNEYAKSKGCRIQNASEVSFVDAFERKQKS
jgi:hypothetical protein